MANQYTLTNDFAEISEEKGTLYNKGDSAIELASTADTEKGAGILLLTGERRTFSGTLYARSMDAAGLLNVADFNDGGEGGEDNLSGVPLGTILPYSANAQTPPYGFLYCEGQAVSRTMYPDLFALIGTTYGAGDGENTFNIPNLIEAAMLNGSYTKTSYTTAGSATFTASKTGYYKITVKGGGGGGRGASGTSAIYNGGAGGGEGGLTIGYEHLTAGDSISVVVGAGGAGGAAGNNTGANGGNTTVIANNNTYVGGGGGGATSRGGAGGTGTIPGASGAPTKEGTVSQLGAVGGGSGGGIGGSTTGGSGTNGGGGGGGAASTTLYGGGNGGDGYVTIEYIGISTKYMLKAYDAPTPSSAQIDLSQYASALAARLTREQTPAFNKRDVVTVSGSYVAPVTGWYKITVKGGGGGGAGGGVSSGTNIAGAGGGEGGTTIGYEKMTAGQTASVVIGAGGAGGAAGTASSLGGNGGAGGNSTVTVNSTTHIGYGANGMTGGSGSIPGGSAYYGTYTVASATAFAIGGNGANNGGIGGGGYGGNAKSSATTFLAGQSGNPGAVWFEYFDPSLM